MSEQNKHFTELKDIKNMMERSSRFISLSGWSGVAAGTCAIVGAAFALPYIHAHGGLLPQQNQLDSLVNIGTNTPQFHPLDLQELFGSKLFGMAVITFISAFVSAFFFTWIKSKKQGIPLWGFASYRLGINVAIPMIAGGIFCIKLIEQGNFGLIAPATLIFYGLALLNASKYTYNEIRYLGICMLVLGFINCWSMGNGLYFWAFGFGVLHILYGLYMWYAYDKKVDHPQ